jgi:hypothetical protein
LALRGGARGPFSASMRHSLWGDNRSSGRGTKLGLNKMGVGNGGCVGLEGKAKKRNSVLLDSYALGPQRGARWNMVKKRPSSDVGAAFPKVILQ